MDAAQRSEAWFAARLGKVTGSGMANVLARTKTGEAATRRNYRAQLVVERLTGKRQESYQNAAMQWGTDTEDLAKFAYTMRTLRDVKDIGFIEHEALAAGVSPDGLVGDDGLIEIKCPTMGNHIEYLRGGVLPPQYKPQVQGQMWVTGRQWCDFVSFDPRVPENAQLLIVRVERDEEYITALAGEVERFLVEVAEEVEFVGNYGNEKVKQGPEMWN